MCQVNEEIGSRVQNNSTTPKKEALCWCLRHAFSSDSQPAE